MRRGGPPMLPVDPADVPAVSRVERGPRGLRLVPVAGVGADGPHSGPMRLRAAAPVAMREATVVAGGKLVLALGAGLVMSVRLPQVHVIHDRRPPGVDRAVGAPGANAGLVRTGDGWRAVVLPSLGDIAADLGPGPAAIRADGRAVAAVRDGEVVEWAVGDEQPSARHAGGGSLLCYAADGSLQVARGAAVTAPGGPEAEGPAIVALAAAAEAPRIAALHDDDTISVWEPGADAPRARWASPLPAARSIALSADGALVALGDPDGGDPSAALVNSEDGTLARRVDGARVMSPSPARDGIVVAGDWGCAWLTPPEEDR